MALAEYAKTMEETIWGPQVYFIFSVVNFVEMIFGVIIGWYAIENSLSGGVFSVAFAIFGFIGQCMAVPSIALSSVWIWVNMPYGVYERGKLTRLGAKFGPEEPYIGSFFAGTMAAKWLHWTYAWITIIFLMVAFFF